MTARNEIFVAAPPNAVFAVLDDPCAYPTWVVGTRRIRRVDDAWPAEGSEFHHAIGVPGAEIQDSTEVLRHDPPHHLVLEVRFRPSGVGRVELDVVPADGGSRVIMVEELQSGPVTWLPSFVSDAFLSGRNQWSLRRLRREIERERRRVP
jgi:uncharacterized protein YndB with AHSA1/START domain